MIHISIVKQLLGLPYFICNLIAATIYIRLSVLLFFLYVRPPGLYTGVSNCQVQVFVFTRHNKWAEVDTSLWTLHFGSAKPKQVCKDCFEPGYLYCDMESTAEADTPGKNPKERRLRRQAPYNLPVCLRWNRPWGCRMSDCRYRHVCSHCDNPKYKVHECPRKHREQGNRDEKGPYPFRSQGAGPP